MEAFLGQAISFLKDIHPIWYLALVMWVHTLWVDGPRRVIRTTRNIPSVPRLLLEFFKTYQSKGDALASIYICFLFVFVWVWLYVLSVRYASPPPPDFDGLYLMMNSCA